MDAIYQGVGMAAAVAWVALLIAAVATLKWVHMLCWFQCIVIMVHASMRSSIWGLLYSAALLIIFEAAYFGADAWGKITESQKVTRDNRIVFAAYALAAILTGLTVFSFTSYDVRINNYGEIISLILLFTAMALYSGNCLCVFIGRIIGNKHNKKLTDIKMEKIYSRGMITFIKLTAKDSEGNKYSFSITRKAYKKLRSEKYADVRITEGLNLRRYASLTRVNTRKWANIDYR